MFWIRIKKKHLTGDANEARNTLADSRLWKTHYGRNHQRIRIFRIHLAWLSNVLRKQWDIVLKHLENLPATSSRTAPKILRIMEHIYRSRRNYIAAAGSFPKRETLARMIKSWWYRWLFTVKTSRFTWPQLIRTWTFLDAKDIGSTPNGYQLYATHMITDGSRTVPVVYCTARRKDRNTYDRIFQFLKDRPPSSFIRQFAVEFSRSRQALFSANKRFSSIEE